MFADEVIPKDNKEGAKPKHVGKVSVIFAAKRTPGVTPIARKKLASQAAPCWIMRRIPK